MRVEPVSTLSFGPFLAKLVACLIYEKVSLNCFHNIIRMIFSVVFIVVGTPAGVVN